MQSLTYFIYFLVILFTFSTVQSKKSVDEQHCEGKNDDSYIHFISLNLILVCIKTINTFADTLTADEKSNPEKIEKAFKKYCSKVKVDTKEHRLVNI